MFILYLFSGFIPHVPPPYGLLQITWRKAVRSYSFSGSSPYPPYSVSFYTQKNVFIILQLSMNKYYHWDPNKTFFFEYNQYLVEVYI